MTTGSPLFIAAFFATIIAMLALAAGGSRKVRSAYDFSLAGRKAGSWNVAGSIMGTLVGGASTVGTVQLAFLYGLSAWWFTLGSGLACLFLGLALAPALRRGMVETIPQFISRYHGERARICASLFSAAGMFVHIVAQLLACGAILATLFDLPILYGAILSSALVALFTLCGGMQSAGMLGLFKLFLLYLTMVTAGVTAFSLTGGWEGMRSVFPAYPWFSPFGYGVKEGVSDLVSMLVGVVSTQTYLQAVFSARNESIARRGALISAVLIPPLGILGISVGLFMRYTHPRIDSARALPAFLIEHFPPMLSGIAFAALLIAAVGTASGLTLGVGTTLKVDILSKLRMDGKTELAVTRLITMGVLLAAMGILLFNLHSAIMRWSFLSMGLRGATLCLPLLAAIFLKERTSRRGRPGCRNHCRCRRHQVPTPVLRPHGLPHGHSHRLLARPAERKGPVADIKRPLPRQKSGLEYLPANHKRSGPVEASYLRL
ncbi:MAG: soluteNa+ symporter SSS [Geobacteraceae bacterium]|nr:MAG: soluteNa+ symporter SSS [Geobacteraceae bacterium]